MVDVHVQKTCFLLIIESNLSQEPACLPSWCATKSREIDMHLRQYPKKPCKCK